jgi:hypothetical protein
MNSYKIQPLKPAPGFKELDEMRLLLAYLKCGDLTLHYCKNDLGLSAPLETVELLQFLGKKKGFKIIYCRKSSTFKLTDKCIEPLKEQLGKFPPWFLTRVENFFVGSGLPYSSRIVDFCLTLKERWNG